MSLSAVPKRAVGRFDFLTVASLVLAIREFRAARRTGQWRTGATWGLVVSGVVLVFSCFGCHALLTM
ncbi:hypothetical protein CTZ27_28920 [Streptomyces griseocarneus]|nr:hypothetical protein CTZ27_28920 [Streptomyces griseocarneus]